MDWCMNHRDIFVRSAPRESTSTHDQTTCRGIVPSSIDIIAHNEADLSLVDTFA